MPLEMRDIPSHGSDMPSYTELWVKSQFRRPARSRPVSGSVGLVEQRDLCMGPGSVTSGQENESTACIVSD